MKKIKTIRVSQEVFEALELVKNKLNSPTWSEVLGYLAAAEKPRVELKGSALAERTIIKFLVNGFDGKITATELRKYTPVNLTGCKRALELWEDEVEKFNSKFTK